MKHVVMKRVKECSRVKRLPITYYKATMVRKTGKEYKCVFLDVDKVEKLKDTAKRRGWQKLDVELVARLSNNEYIKLNYYNYTK